MARHRLRVLVVDDFAAFRRLVSWIVQDAPAMEIVGEATDGLEAVSKAEELRPDVVVLDIGLPQINGIEVARRIREMAGHSKIIFLSENALVETAREALSIGNAFVMKSDATHDLLAAIDAAVHGKKFASRGLARHKLT